MGVNFIDEAHELNSKGVARIFHSFSSTFGTHCTVPLARRASDHSCNSKEISADTGHVSDVLFPYLGFGMIGFIGPDRGGGVVDRVRDIEKLGESVPEPTRSAKGFENWCFFIQTYHSMMNLTNPTKSRRTPINTTIVPNTPIFTVHKTTFRVSSLLLIQGILFEISAENTMQITPMISNTTLIQNI
jgi:hypothetical protein